MTLPYVKKLSSELGVSIKKSEEYWAYAKARQDKKSMGYVMNIFKALMQRHARKSQLSKESYLRAHPKKVVENFYDLNVPLQIWNDELDRHNIDHLGNDNVYTSVIASSSPLEAEAQMRNMGLPFSRKPINLHGQTFYTSTTGKILGYHDHIKQELRLHKDLNQIIMPYYVIGNK